MYQIFIAKYPGKVMLLVVFVWLASGRFGGSSGAAGSWDSSLQQGGLYR